jgi:glycosyl transferase family 25
MDSSNLKYCYYINLDERPDRKIHVENQLKLLNIPYERFKAIKTTNGAIGCSLSHLSILTLAKEKKLPYVLIVEDDIQFLNKTLFIKNFKLFLDSIYDFDVLLIAGNNMPPYEKINDYCVKVSSCQTTTGYLVKQHYYDTLINNIKTGINKLLKEPSNGIFFAIDKFWFNLQARDKWYLLTPLTVIQRADYSDIEKRTTNYSNLMLDLDKKEYIKYLESKQKMINMKHSLNNRLF